MANVPVQFDNVSVTCKANVYFEGKVVSHTIVTQQGAKKTLGVVYPGSFKFNTSAPERMDIISGSCRVRIANQADRATYGAGDFFRVPGNSHFKVEVEHGMMEYLCTFE